MLENVDVRLLAISCDDLPLEGNLGICVLEWFTGLFLSGFSANKAIYF